MNDNEPLFDETGEMTSDEKAKEQVDAVRSLREWQGPCADINAKKLESIDNLISLFDNEEIDEYDLTDSIRDILAING